MAHKDPQTSEAILLETKAETTILELVSATCPAMIALPGETLSEAITTSEPTARGTSN